MFNENCVMFADHPALVRSIKDQLRFTQVLAVSEPSFDFGGQVIELKCRKADTTATKDANRMFSIPKLLGEFVGEMLNTPHKVLFVHSIISQEEDDQQTFSIRYNYV